jgi:glycosyltransferase involved in cell wall biosynthesis
MSLNGFEIGVIVPAFNEEKSIGSTITALKKLPVIDRILVVDDGSTDRTSQIAVAAGAEVLTLEKNSGKAKAMQKGYEALSCSVLVFIDADLGESAVETIKLIKPVCMGKAEAVIARFPMTPGKGGFGFVKKLSRWGLTLITGRTVPSVLSGQRAFLRRVLSSESFNYSGFGIEFGMTADLLIKGIDILEVDVTMKHRTTGRDFRGFAHRYRQFKDILRVVLKKLAKKPFERLEINVPKE